MHPFGSVADHMNLVGVDCATDEKKIGLAFGVFSARVLTIEDTLLCGRESAAAATVEARLRHATGQTLIAIDAPLGWPHSMPVALSQHRAGDEIQVDPSRMFRRATDRFIKETLGKTPLDVGADRIARTAHAALRLLGELRRRLQIRIPLAWDATFSDPVAAIEVYPAATLTAHGMRAGGYKKPSQALERREILTSLQAHATLPADVSRMETNADVLDAAVCLSAAADFLSGSAAGPQDVSRAQTEGWIWAKAGAERTAGPSGRCDPTRRPRIRG